MDAQALLEKLLTSGKELASQGMEAAKQGVNYAADKIGVPGEDGEKRDAMVSGLTKGAVAGGLVALLLGTRSGRRIAGPALKLGTLAAVGGLAYKVYSDWKSNQGQAIEGQAITGLNGPEAETRALALIRSMIGAAKSDGHIDAEEQNRIVEELKQMGLGDQATGILITELQKPLDVDEISAGADSQEAAVELYLASLIVTDTQNADERKFLNKLADGLNLDQQLVQQLESAALMAG